MTAEELKQYTRFQVILFHPRSPQMYGVCFCRLAMIAIAGFVAQELVEKKEIVYQIGLGKAAEAVPPN